MTALNNNKETSINPMIIMDKAIDMSTRLSGNQFPVSIFPPRFRESSRRYTNATVFLPTIYQQPYLLHWLLVSATRTWHR